MYAIGETRTLSTSNVSGDVHVVISDFVGGQRVQFNPSCWSAFRSEVENIEEAVKQLSNRQYVKYFCHIGDNWYVSVTTGFRCVDIRRFYTTVNGQLKPKREGIALRLDEWKNLLASVPVMDADLTVAVYHDDKEQCDCGDHLLRCNHVV